MPGALVPATDASVDTMSYHEFGTGRFFVARVHAVPLDNCVPEEETRNSAYVSPLRATREELNGPPLALVIAAENDPLGDDGEAYARKLKEAGVEVSAVRYNGAIHDFVLLNAIRHLSSRERRHPVDRWRRTRPTAGPASYSANEAPYERRAHHRRKARGDPG